MPLWTVTDLFYVTLQFTASFCILPQNVLCNICVTFESFPLLSLPRLLSGSQILSFGMLQLQPTNFRNVSAIQNDPA